MRSLGYPSLVARPSAEGMREIATLKPVCATLEALGLEITFVPIKKENAA